MPAPSPATAPQPWCPYLWDADYPFDPEGGDGILHDQHYCDRRAGHGDDEAHRCGWCGAVTAATHPPPSSTGGAQP